MNGSRPPTCPAANPPPCPTTNPPPPAAIGPTTGADTSPSMSHPRCGADASAPSTYPVGWSPAGGQRVVEAHYNYPNRYAQRYAPTLVGNWWRSEEHTSELQSRGHLVCRLLLEQ